MKTAMAEIGTYKAILNDLGEFLQERNLLDGSSAVVYSAKKAIEDQAKRISELEAALIEERARGLFNGTWCSDLPDDCGFDAEMNAAKIEARKQLHSEGKI